MCFKVFIGLSATGCNNISGQMSVVARGLYVLFYDVLGQIFWINTDTMPGMPCPWIFAEISFSVWFWFVWACGIGVKSEWWFFWVHRSTGWQKGGSHFLWEGGSPKTGQNALAISWPLLSMCMISHSLHKPIFCLLAVWMIDSGYLWIKSLALMLAL